ncbi:MAG: hypothetical protein RDU14_09935 [Melioribacteraceae bacterium]|nr:hypothetical protein [Melioribacteraceae bacterium]
MRLLKENTIRYESFTNSLQYFSKSPGNSGDLRLISFEAHNKRSNQLEKYDYFIQNLFGFQKKVTELQTSLEIHDMFIHFVKKLLVAKEVDLFLYDESKINLIAINTNVSVAQNNLVNKAQKDGVLDWLFETRKPTVIPELSSFAGNGVKLCQTLFPIVYDNMRLGVLSLLGPTNRISEDSLENQAIQILIGIVVPKIITIKQRTEINKLFGDVQLYQTKLNNEFRLYAVGEYAEGILQNIQNSLQVIMSSVEFITGENGNVDIEVVEKIKDKIAHIRDLSQRLMKFNEVKTQSDDHNVPCNLNSTLKETFELAEPTLTSLEMECESDLENELPLVISNPKHLKQITTNVFSLLKRKSKKGSGLFIQSRAVNDIVILSFFLTDYWKDINSHQDPIVNLTIRIIKELMKKNEGIAEFDSLPMKGTTIHLLFPLKRKLKE